MLPSALRPLLLLCAALLLTAPPASAQNDPARLDTVRLSLQEALARSLKVSPEVGRRRAQRAFAEARHDEAQASRFLTQFQLTTAHSVAPGLDIPADNTRPTDALYLNPDVENDWDDLRPFNAIDVELTQPIWTWGELSGSIEAARYGIGVEEAAVRAQALEVALRTGQIYYNLLLTEALTNVIDEAGEIVERAEREVQRLLEEGAQDVDNADLFQVQITEQEYQRRVVELRQSRKLARSALRRQLFLPARTVVRLADRFLEPIDLRLDSLEVYIQRALARRPEIDQATAGIRALDALVEVARSDYYPKLFFRASGSLSYAAGRYRQESAYISEPFLGRGTRTGFGIRQNLNFFQTQARVEQARAERNAVRYQKEAAAQLIRFETEEAYRRLLIARGDVEARDEQLRLSDEWLRTEQINFDLNLGDTENLVDAVRQNLELQAAYYEAVRNYNVAVLRLLRATGVLADPAEVGTLLGLTE